MGRVKLNMHLISNEKARLTTFHKRKSGLIKKASELQTLCSVDVCLIIYAPKTNECPMSQSKIIWPLDNHDKVKRTIESYKRQPMEGKNKQTIDLWFYFENRKEKMEDKLKKLKTKNNEALYSSWEERYGNFNEDELRNIASILQDKFNEVRVRFNLIRNIDGNNHHVSHQLGFFPQNQFSPYLMNEAMLGFFRESIAYATPPTMMLMNDNNDYFVNANDNGYEQTFYNQTNNFSSIYPHTNPPMSCYRIDNQLMVTPDIYPSLEYYGPQIPQLPETDFMSGAPFQVYNMEHATQDNIIDGFSNVINGCNYGSSNNGL